MNNTTQRNITDFFSNEVRDFSVYACKRAIPSGIDGFKPSQRKILFGMSKEYPTQEVKVSIAAATIMAVSCYHHGSLEGVMVNMAQNFPGSNNTPLLEGIGQFGSRLSPDAAAPRYIFTKLSSACKQLFHSVDDNILEWEEDDGTRIEPKFYLPILPMVLVNGASGMGTGYATNIPGHNPKDLKDAVVAILNGKKPKPLVPWYRGFSGTITSDGTQNTVSGVLESINTTQLVIKELPVGNYTIAYRDVLNSLEDSGMIKSYDDNSSEEKTEFIIHVTRAFSSGTQADLMKIFKLVSRDTPNLVVWDENHKIRKFADTMELLKWFVGYRLTKYEDRRQYMLRAAADVHAALTEEMKFIRLYLKRSTIWSKTTAAIIEQELVDAGFSSPKSLLAIRISRLNADAIQELQSKILDKEAEITKLTASTATDLYLEDLSNLKV